MPKMQPVTAAKKLDKEKIAKIIILAFAAYCLWMMGYAEGLADTIFNGNLFTALFLYMLTSPAYILIIAGIMATHKDKLFKAFMSGLFVSFAVDIVTLPRLPSTVPSDLGSLAATKALMMGPDLILAKASILAGIPYNIFWWVYYFVLPVGLMILAAKLLGYAEFLDKLIGKEK